MKTKLFLLIVLFQTLNTLISAQQISEKWRNVNQDFEGFGYQIQAASDGFVYVFGEHYNSTGIDIFIKKFDIVGNEIWSKIYNNYPEKSISPYQMTIENNFIYILGSISNSTITNNNDLLVIKYTTSGLFLWDAIYTNPDNSNNSPKKIFVKNGIVYIAGYIGQYFNNTDIGIIKYDFNGIFQWAKRYGNTWNTNDNVTDLQLDSQNNIYIAGFSKTDASSSSNLFIQKYTPSGNLIWTRGFVNPNYNSPDYYNYVTMLIDSSKYIYLSGDISNNPGFRLITLKYDSAGNSLWSNIDTTKNFVSSNRNKTLFMDATGNIHVQTLQGNYNSTQQWVLHFTYDSQGGLISRKKWTSNSFTNGGSISSFLIDNNNNLYLLGNNKKISYPNDRYCLFEKINSNNQKIWYSIIDYNTTAEQGFYLSSDSNQNIYILGIALSNYLLVAKYCGYCNSLIKGYVFNDINGNCVKDQIEIGLSGILLKTEPNINFAITDSIGNFAFFVDTGIYNVKEILPNSFWNEICPTALQYSVHLTPSQVTATGINFGNQIVTYCPILTVDITTSRLRRCAANNYYKVDYCNIGTAVANNTYITINFDVNITPLSSSLPWSSHNGNIYTFNIGTLNPNECGSFQITDSVSCSAELGMTLCTEAKIFPDSICEPVNPVWDKSSITVTGKCVGDSLVCFVIKNTGEFGNGDMDGLSTIRVYEDNFLIETFTFQLAGGDSIVKCYTANGKTIRLEADQRPGHLGNSHPKATVENCGNSANPSLGLVTSVPEDDADRNVEIDCHEIIGSYDPNEKSVKPKGITTNKYIKSTDILEYQINFQNTGTDTAILVIVRDTLSQYLDITTVQNGVSSHSCIFKIYGAGILEWTFKNIQLPDSNINEPASNGFVKFNVSQKKNTPQSLGVV